MISLLTVWGQARAGNRECKSSCLCLHLGIAKVWTCSFLISSPLWYKSAHLWPSAKQLYQRASAECVVTWLPSLALSQLHKGHGTVLFQALLKNYMIKNSSFQIANVKSLFMTEAEKPSFTGFFQCLPVLLGRVLALVRFTGGKRCLWTGGYACLTLHCFLKTSSVSLVTRQTCSDSL